MIRAILLVLLCLLVASGCATVQAPSRSTKSSRAKAHKKPKAAPGAKEKPAAGSPELEIAMGEAAVTDAPKDTPKDAPAEALTSPHGEATPSGVPGPEALAAAEVGIASFYADSLKGRATASGDRYDPDRRTCAHRTLPFGTKVSVTLIDTGAAATCTVNDRGPYARARILDVSRKVAEQLGLIDRGTARVRVVVLDGQPKVGGSLDVHGVLPSAMVALGDLPR